MMVVGVVWEQTRAVIGYDDRLTNPDHRRSNVLVGETVLPVRPQGRRAEIDQVGLVVVREKTERLVVSAGESERFVR